MPLTSVMGVPVLIQLLGWLPLLRAVCAAKSMADPVVQAMLTQVLRQVTLPSTVPAGLSVGQLVKALWEQSVEALVRHCARETSSETILVRHFRDAMWKRRPSFMAHKKMRAAGFEGFHDHLLRFGKHPQLWVQVQSVEEASPGWTDHFTEKTYVLRLCYVGFEIELHHVERTLLYTDI